MMGGDFGIDLLYQAVIFRIYLFIKTIKYFIKDLFFEKENFVKQFWL